VGASCPATACLALLCRVSPFLAPQPPPAPWKQCRAILRNLGGGWFVGEGGRARGRGRCGNTFRSGFPFPLHARPCRVHLHLNPLPPSSFFRKRVDSGVWMAWGGWRELQWLVVGLGGGAKRGGWAKNSAERIPHDQPRRPVPVPSWARPLAPLFLFVIVSMWWGGLLGGACGVQCVWGGGRGRVREGCLLRPQAHHALPSLPCEPCSRPFWRPLDKERFCAQGL
jgi:hypothetical protein